MAEVIIGLSAHVLGSRTRFIYQCGVQESSIVQLIQGCRFHVSLRCFEHAWLMHFFRICTPNDSSTCTLDTRHAGRLVCMQKQMINKGLEPAKLYNLLFHNYCCSDQVFRIVEVITLQMDTYLSAS